MRRGERVLGRRRAPRRMDGAGPVVLRTEERLARAMSHVRLGTAVLVAVPLVRRSQLDRAGMAVCAAGAALGQAVWFRRRVVATGTLRDPTLVWGDAAGCAMVNFLASRSVSASHRNTGMVQAVSHSLTAAGTAGFGLGWSPGGVAATGAITADWALSVWPAVSVKLVSDALGMGIWFAVAHLTGREFREMASMVERAQAHASASEAEAAERRRDAEMARQHEVAHREIHDHLLPVVDAVAEGRLAEVDLTRVARRAAHRARRFILDGRGESAVGFEGMLSDTFDTFREAGRPLVLTTRIVAEPPGELVEPLAAAVREALVNVVKHVRTTDEVTVFVESTEGGGEAVIRDRGPGFSTGTVVRGGGMARTYEQVRRHGGSVAIESAPGSGTRLHIRWGDAARWKS